MARYEHLPIYKAALDLTVHMERVVAGFARYHKYTLGTELRQGSRALLMQVLRANNAATAAQRGNELLNLCRLPVSTTDSGSAVCSVCVTGTLSR